MANSNNDSELASSNKIPHWRFIIDQASVPPEIANFSYARSGAKNIPYLLT